MAARLKIVILEKRYAQTQSFNVLFWCDVPATRQAFYANQDAESVWKDRTAEDLAKLRAGEVVEFLEPYQAPQGQTLAQAQAALQALHAIKQSQVDASNPWLRFGTHWDGTTWTAAGVS